MEATTAAASSSGVQRRAKPEPYLGSACRVVPPQRGREPGKDRGDQQALRYLRRDQKKNPVASLLMQAFF
jgi:hypothetical protein